MKKHLDRYVAEAILWLAGALLVGCSLGAILSHHYSEGVPELLIGALGLWYGRGWVFPKV